MRETNFMGYAPFFVETNAVGMKVIFLQLSYLPPFILEEGYGTLVMME